MSTLPADPSPRAAAAGGATQALWQLRQVRKIYQKRVVVDVEDLELREGEAVALLGSNGSGKSTLLRLLAEIAPITSGSIVKSAAAETLRTAIVPQAGGTYTGATVLENLKIRAGLYGTRLSADVESAWYISTFKLDGFLKTQVGRLSGGYQRLCAIACALCVGPSCLLLDEPFSGLDAVQSASLRQCLVRLKPDLRFLAVTGHFTGDFDAFFRIIEIRDGKIFNSRDGKVV